MLSSISLENYKSFINLHSLKLKPLTLLCGINSSGKSSILKSVLMMKQTIEKETPYNKLSFIGKYVDNGYWDDIINESLIDNTSATFTISNEFTINEKDISGINLSDDVPAWKELKKLYFFDRTIKGFRLTHTIKVGKACNVNNRTLTSFIESNNVVLCQIRIQPLFKDNDESDYTAVITLEKIGNTERDYYLSYSKLPSDGVLRDSNRKHICKCYFNNIKLTSIYMDNMPNQLKRDKSIVFSIFNIIAMQYGNIGFIAPLRQAPSRNYIIKGDVESVGIAGEDTPIYIAKYANRKFKDNIPIPQKQPDDYFIDFTSSLSTKALFQDRLQKWMDYFDLGKLSFRDTKTGLMSLFIDNHNISDVGFGVSQLLPIIAQGLNMSPDSVLLLEQPEIHLHPQMQMQMADFLLALACANRNLIVETHSDHVVNRLIKRMMEDTSGTLRSKVAIYFVENTNEGSLVTEIKTDSVQGVVDAPIQFFGQYGVEINEITHLGYRNLLARKKEDKDV